MNTQNNSEEFRRACEARHVLRLRKEARQAYYAGVEKQRGLPARTQLVADVMAEHAKLKELSAGAV